MYINISLNLKTMVLTGVIAGLGFLLYKETKKNEALTKNKEEAGMNC